MTDVLLQLGHLAAQNQQVNTERVAYQDEHERFSATRTRRDQSNGEATQLTKLQSAYKGMFL
jgi:hypothetical protein